MIQDESEMSLIYKKQSGRDDQSMGSMISVGLGLGIQLPKHMLQNRYKSPTNKVQNVTKCDPDNAGHQIKFYYSHGLRKFKF